jgi:hypothetical protein
MKVFRNIVAVMALGTVMTGCFYYPHDRGEHRGDYERDRGYHQGQDRGDHRDDRNRNHDNGRDHHD